MQISYFENSARKYHEGIKMKICYIADAQSIHTQRWVKWFAERGHEVHLITDKPAEIDNVKIYPVKGRGKKINFLIRAWETRKLVKKIKPDILHVHYAFGYGTFGAFANYHPFIVTAWGSDVLIEPKESFLKRHVVKYVLKKADVVHSVGKNLTKELVTLVADQKKIITVPMGINIDIFNPSVEPLFKKENIVISTRNLEPIYNVELLIKAIPLVVNEIPDVEFIIAGEGGQRAYLENMAKKLSVSEHVRFVGHIPNKELPKWLTSSKVYVSTSLSDSLGISNLEAMACGVFPVATNLPAIREWIKDDENGFLVPVDKPKILAQKIVKALQGNILRRKAAEINQKIIKERVDWNKNFKKLEELYKKLKGEMSL